MTRSILMCIITGQICAIILFYADLKSILTAGKLELN